MKKSTRNLVNPLRVQASRVKKSAATITSRCLDRNSFQVVFRSRSGAGSSPCSFRRLARVPRATSWPRLASARWVESRCGAVVQSRVGVTGPSWPSVPRKQLQLRFHTPLIKPDVPVSGIRLSDGLHRRLTDERHIGYREAELLPASRISFRQKTDGCPASAPYVASSRNGVRFHRRGCPPLDRPSSEYRRRSTLPNPEGFDSNECVFLPRDW